ncbi:MAG TPA: cation:proton antiporter [Geminicoccaceae bacterium]|nr:cation:proton antiporter [Geminicoccaceae bacterium]
MTSFQFVALLLASIGPILALGRVAPVPDTLVLFGAGLATTLVPGLPPSRLDPQLALELFLPPLLYAGASRASFHLLRFSLVSGVLLGAALSLATVAAVAVAGRLLLGLPWTAAVLLGAVAAVFDTRLFHEAEGRPHVPRPLADALKAREMVARVVVVSTLALALQALEDEVPSTGAVLLHVAWDLAGGAVLGLALGRAVAWLRERVRPAPVEIAVSIATPYLGSLASTALGVSVVVTVITAALVIAAVRIDPRTGVQRTSAEARVSAVAFWEEVNLILSAVLFFMAGRALPEAMAGLRGWPLGWLLGVAAGLLALVLVVQFAFSLAAAALPYPAEELGMREAPARAPAAVAVAGVMTWASTRSVIGLVIALSVPAALPDGRPFPERDLILAVAAVMIVGSVLLQGLTLGAVVRRAGLAERAETEAERQAAQEAMGMARAETDGSGFDAGRRAVLELRGQNRIGDEVTREMLRETDLHQRATEESPLPGAGPPNP